jgi:hypothetical protein
MRKPMSVIVYEMLKEAEFSFREMNQVLLEQHHTLESLSHDLKDRVLDGTVRKAEKVLKEVGGGAGSQGANARSASPRETRNALD